MTDMPPSTALLFAVIIAVLVGLGVIWFQKWNEPKARDDRATARKRRKQRKWSRKLHARIQADEFDRAWRNGQFSVGRDAKDRHL